MQLRLRPWIVGVVTAALLCLSLASAQAQGGAALTAGEVALAAAQQDTAGAAVFARNCQVCHGIRASGRYGPPLNVLPPEIAALPPEAIAAELTGLVRSGIPGYMPGFLPEQLPDADIVPLTQYILSQNGSVPGPSLYEALEPVSSAASGRTLFSQTGHSVGGEFRDFWNRNGGLRIFGYPLTEEYNAVGEDGNVYRMQLFERARMELDPNAPAGQRVRLSRLGALELDLRTYFMSGQGPPLPEGPPPGAGQGAPPANP